MDLVFAPFVGLGPLKFGMSETEVNPLKENLTGIDEFVYQDGKLCAFSLYPDEAEHLFFTSEDILEMERLPAALFFANRSNDYGQAQGGSLYFMDLGCAILQFESSWREFFFFSSTYNTNEPLCNMTPESIEDYYEYQTCQDEEEENSLEDSQEEDNREESQKGYYLGDFKISETSEQLIDKQLIDKQLIDVGTIKPWWKFW